MSDAEPAAPKQRRADVLREHAFKPGQSGNPKGREKGSRNKLTEQFVADIYADWQEHGVQAIKDVRDKSPTDYLKVVAGVITKDVAVTVRDYDDLSDEELADQFARASARLARGHAFGGRDGAARGKVELPN